MANINSMNVGGQLSMIEDTAARDMEAKSYDPTQTYIKEDICIYNDKLYEASHDIAPEAFNIAHWTETTLGKIIQKHRDSISKLIDDMEWVKVGELSGTIIGKSIPATMIGGHTPKEYLVKWRLFPTHPWNYVIVNAASLSTTDKHMGSFYFSPTFYASFSFILSGGGLSVESSYTGGKHSNTDLANPENAKIVLYYK